MSKLVPYLYFNGNCEEAMKFYERCFSGKLTILRASETSAFDHLPDDKRKQIMHSSISVEGETILEGSDSLNDTSILGGNSVCLNYEANDLEQLKGVFTELSRNGKVESEVSKQFWGGYYDSLLDRFGFRWMLTCPA